MSSSSQPKTAHSGGADACADARQGEGPDPLATYAHLLTTYAQHLREHEFNPYQPIPLLLLRSFNPAFQLRFWRSTIPFFKVPNTLNQDFPDGFVVLRQLEVLDDATLRAVAECSRINCRRLLKRSVLGWFPKVGALALGLFAVPKAIKEGFGVDLLTTLAPFFVGPILAGLFVGALIGAIGNFVLSAPAVGFSRAVDDLIAVAVAARGTTK
jgi:hypothetical protein